MLHILQSSKCYLSSLHKGKEKGGNVLFNNPLDTFCLDIWHQDIWYRLFSVDRLHVVYSCKQIVPFVIIFLIPASAPRLV